MSSYRLLRRLLLLLFVLSAVQAALNASELPTLSAAWFDASGRAFWYVRTWRLMWAHALVAGLLVALAWVLPERLVDVPASSRRPDPRDALLRLCAWLGILTLLVLTAVMQVVYDANRRPIPELAPLGIVALVGSWVAFVAFWVWAFRRARRAALESTHGDDGRA